jgi:DNA polymerase delta subunit 2
VKKISELNEDNPETCIIIGTFYKDQVLKPSILKEISNDHKDKEPARDTLNANYHHESDKLILEDDVQRIRLEGNINVAEMITGVVGAVLGKSKNHSEPLKTL